MRLLRLLRLLRTGYFSSAACVATKLKTKSGVAAKRCKGKPPSCPSPALAGEGTRASEHYPNLKRSFSLLPLLRTGYFSSAACVATKLKTKSEVAAKRYKPEQKIFYVLFVLFCG